MTSMSQVCSECSFKRSPAAVSKLTDSGPKGNSMRARSASPTAEKALTRRSSSTSESSAFARGDFAFHSSHTGWATSSGRAAPARAASSRRLMSTAPEPRCDSTSAIVQPGQ